MASSQGCDVESACSMRVTQVSEIDNWQGVVLSMGYLEIQLETVNKVDLTNLTEIVENAVEKAGVVNGTVHIAALHTTAAVVVTEWQQALNHDVSRWLEKVVDGGDDWEHNDPLKSDCDRSNAVSHLKGLLLGPSVSLPVRDRKVVRGQWQSIVFIELDGPRTRRVLIQVMGA